MTRAQRSLWILTALTILAAGLVAQALAGSAGLGTHILLVVSLLLLATCGLLLIRVLRYLARSGTTTADAGSGQLPEGRRAPS
jgi:apolipoprotein N-acyltransferase